MINEKINDQHTVAEWEEWRVKKYPPHVNRENIECDWWIWDADDDLTWDKIEAYHFRSSYFPHPDPTESSHANWMAQDFMEKNWDDWDYPKEVNLYVEDELGRRYKLTVYAEQTTEFNACETKMTMEEAWPKENDDG